MDIKDASNMPNWVLTDEQRAPNYITPTSSRIIFTFDQLLRFLNLYAYNIMIFNVHGQLCIGARGYLTISIRDALWLSSRGLDYLFTWDTDLCP